MHFELEITSIFDMKPMQVARMHIQNGKKQNNPIKEALEYSPNPPLSAT
jgi:hypothetical protein